MFSTSTEQGQTASPCGVCAGHTGAHPGDLVASAAGEMLTAQTSTTGSAGYVAIEWVSRTPHGREGGFALQHNGTLNRGVPQLSVTVVPDSGSGALTGLSGGRAGAQAGVVSPVWCCRFGVVR